MEFAEIEKEAQDRLDTYYIAVWEGCDDLIAEGVREFRDRWSNYSVHSYRKDPRNHLKGSDAKIVKDSDRRPISELISEVLDPKVAAFLNSLPKTHFHFFPNPSWNLCYSPVHDPKNESPITERFDRKASAKKEVKFKAERPLTNLIVMMGLKNSHDAIKQQLRHFLKTEHQCRAIDFGYQATIDTLLELLWQLHQTPTRFKQHSADNVRASSIARFQPRDRSLSPEEISLMYKYLEKVGTSPVNRAAAKLLLLTMVRKSELSQAKWSEINFSEALWSIPKERMKRRKPHLVFLSRQAVDLLIALKTFAGGSEYVLPARYDSDGPISNATINRVLDYTYKAAQKDGYPLEKFGPHDLRRTASTLLHEAGYNSDWIEKSLAHEQKGVRAIYNKAEYREQRAAMLQDWADMIDDWVLKGN
jgi:integrase